VHSHRSAARAEGNSVQLGGAMGRPRLVSRRLKRRRRESPLNAPATTVNRSPSRILLAAGLATLFVCYFANPVTADAAGGARGWKLEQDVEQPSYAVIEPTKATVNIDTVVLACEKAKNRNLLQLQIYLAAEQSLSPKNHVRYDLKVDTHAEITIDSRAFPVELLFADDYVVLADAERLFPLLSDALLDAMESGRTMVLRFYFIPENAGQDASFDGSAVIHLQAGAGGAAIAAVRRCAEPKSGRDRGVSISGF
jgi:hypothetical protein